MNPETFMISLKEETIVDIRILGDMLRLVTSYVADFSLIRSRAERWRGVQYAECKSRMPPPVPVIVSIWPNCVGWKTRMIGDRGTRIGPLFILRIRRYLQVEIAPKLVTSASKKLLNTFSANIDGIATFKKNTSEYKFLQIRRWITRATGVPA